MKAVLAVQCSNCLGDPLRLDRRTMTIAYSAPASGRGSKRVPARVVVEDVIDDGGLLRWVSPCCPGYEDSLELD